LQDRLKRLVELYLSVPKKPHLPIGAIVQKQLRDIVETANHIRQEGDMTALAARFFPKASAETVAEFETLVSVALFCGVGLLMSLSVLVLDQYIPGEWF
jgi:hypothetical protein